MLLVVAVVKTDVKPSHDGCLCDGVIVGVFVGCFGHTLAICSSARRRHGRFVVGMVWFSDFCRRFLDMRRHVYSCVGVRGASGCWLAGCHSGAYGVERSLSLPSTILRIITNELWGKFFVNMSAYWRVVSTLMGIMWPSLRQSWIAKCELAIWREALHLALPCIHVIADSESIIDQRSGVRNGFTDRCVQSSDEACVACCCVCCDHFYLA